MNTGNFAGYIGRDAELKTVGQNQVANFSIGVSTFKGGEKSTLWVSCALWGERAAKLAPFLTKSSAVSVSGDVDVRAYSSKSGEPKAEIVCNVQRVTLQGGGKEREDEPKGVPTSTGLPTGAKFEDDKDLPF